MTATSLMRPSSAEEWQRLITGVGRLVARRVDSRADVDDVVQDVLLRVWRHGTALRNDERFGSWLSRIAYTAAADHMRTRRRHPLRAAEPGGEPDTDLRPADEGAEPLAKTLIADVLRPFVENLPPRYRDAVALSELEGLPHATVAARLEISVSAVKSRVQRGRRQLREMLERCCQIALDVRGAPVSCELKPDAEVPPGCCVNGCAPTAAAQEQEVPPVPEPVARP